MEVKEAVTLALTAFAAVFDSEQFLNVALEEFEYDQDSKEYLVTIGFDRERKVLPSNRVSMALNPFADREFKREFKIIRVSDPSGEVTSIKNRPAD